MTETIELAELLYPGVTADPAAVLAAYPRRNLPEGAMVTRFAPSPTGMLHLGGLYAALFSERLAHQSGGVFYLRIEDTDQKREIAASIPGIIDSLAYFGIRCDEGIRGANLETGAYGPYLQSRRAGLYRVFVKELLRRGWAYPCFCSEAELERMRNLQERSGMLSGYYGRWAAHRKFTLEQIRAELERGRPYVIRLKAPQAAHARIAFQDQIKGRLEMADNFQDIVLVKSDGLPTYHLAHVVDDYLMGTTHVIRGDEWLPSVPLHLQLYKALGWEAPAYGHLGPLLKQEGASRRKFSKRKDSDAVTAFYQEQGYPGEAVVEYLLNLLNSNFEAWRRQNPALSWEQFAVSFARTGSGGALFDPAKLLDVSRNRIAGYAAETVYEAALRWSERWNQDFFDLLRCYPEYSVQLLGIERDSAKPRKDWAKWSDLKEDCGYFYDELFYGGLGEGYRFPAELEPGAIREILEEYRAIHGEYRDQAEWFGALRELAGRLGYARDLRSYRADPAAFRGSISQVAMVLRVALCNRTATPELYQIMRVMGPERVRERLERCLQSLNGRAG
ncbi:glutamyl-tRNA synthetase [Hydrogenispora ethanolica]|uniref:Glutamate--tRNA ligase n=1 Tax=Hydrogenispora ethanolica TaxID=1082276 RepID=A0A4R1S898_HYDET|nr:glutamate--tRNA ligase [Hydrogenispora ethanolica]TCL75110.1 glutamyl-tRNA synthetase [Hydrogenispora ethanolica]